MGKSTEEPWTQASLAKALKTSREDLHWTHEYLAWLSGVSNKTLSDIESGTRPLPRGDVLIRLAIALGASPEKWISKLGKNASDYAQTISSEQASIQVRKGSGAEEVVPPNAENAKTFFGGLKERLQNESTPTLCCVYYTTSPGALSNVSVLNQIADCVSLGMWLAMFSPYPRVKGIKAKPTLSSFYSLVDHDVEHLYGLLSEKVGHEASKRITIFQLKSDHQTSPSMCFTLPPSTPYQVRPILVKQVTVSGEEVSDPEDGATTLHAWITAPGAHFDYFWRFHERRLPNTTIDSGKAWKEFFGGPISGWIGAKCRSWGKIADDSVWEITRP